MSGRDGTDYATHGLPGVPGDSDDVGLTDTGLSSDNDLSGKLSALLLGYGLRPTESTRGGLKVSRHAHSMRPTC